MFTKQSPHFPAPLQSREKLWSMGCGVTFKLKHRGAHVHLSALFSSPWQPWRSPGEVERALGQSSLDLSYWKDNRASGESPRLVANLIQIRNKPCRVKPLRFWGYLLIYHNLAWLTYSVIWDNTRQEGRARPQRDLAVRCLVQRLDFISLGCKNPQRVEMRGMLWNHSGSSGVDRWMDEYRWISQYLKLGLRK